MIALGADHGGYLIKEAVKKFLQENKIHLFKQGLSVRVTPVNVCVRQIPSAQPPNNLFHIQNRGIYALPKFG